MGRVYGEGDDREEGGRRREKGEDASFIQVNICVCVCVCVCVRARARARARVCENSTMKSSKNL
jgi:hypothetical protein